MEARISRENMDTVLIFQEIGRLNFLQQNFLNFLNNFNPGIISLWNTIIQTGLKQQIPQLIPRDIHNCPNQTGQESIISAFQTTGRELLDKPLTIVAQNGLTQHRILSDQHMERFNQQIEGEDGTGFWFQGAK